MELLPGPPKWLYHTVVIKGYQTESPMTLYYRSGLEVARHLFANPIFKEHMEINPYKLFDGNHRVYSEFLSADYAWKYQVSLL